MTEDQRKMGVLHGVLLNIQRAEWPKRVEGFGAFRGGQAFGKCAKCEAWSFVTYGGTHLCIGHASEREA